MTEHKDNTIGAMNGKWAILFRATMAVGAMIQPLIVAWAVWVTSHVYGIQTEMLRMEARLTDKLNALPPPDWRDRIIALEQQVKANHELLLELRFIIKDRKP